MKLKALLLGMIFASPAVNAMTESTFENIKFEVSTWCESVDGYYVDGKRGRICRNAKTYVQKGKFLLEDTVMDYKIFVKITNYETGEVSVLAKPITPTSDDYDPTGAKVVHKFFHEGKW